MFPFKINSFLRMRLCLFIYMLLTIIFIACTSAYSFAISQHGFYKLLKITSLIMPKDYRVCDHKLSLHGTPCQKLFLSYLPQILNDQVVDKLLKTCFRNRSDKNNISRLLNINYVRRNIGNVSCHLQIPRFEKSQHPLTALASFPGSGNSLTREILEQVTGIYTGSIYPDKLAKFTGSHRCPTDGSVFIVKTHSRNVTATRRGCKSMTYSRVIYILRNQFDSVIAEFNRQQLGKTTYASMNEFKSTKWERFVKAYAMSWQMSVLFWLKRYTGSLYVLVYENLISNIMFEIYELSKFINIPMSLKSLYCISINNYDTYFRKYKPKWLVREILYNNTLKADVNKVIKAVLHDLNTNIHISNSLRLYILLQ
ncbi:WSCD family member CG9164-like [Mercenaria mercenaria]|uniref:WSCD family member CG9164-like n=1 Tax=Mercenaria mercenaria TaxID=6596 RepID=UPI00234F5CDB|nr:WSCD family member CG9164-like [Mercenaria mercenaria]